MNDVESVKSNYNMLSSISGKTAISTQLIKELEDKLEKERLVNTWFLS